MTDEEADRILAKNVEKYIALCERGRPPEADADGSSGGPIDLRGFIRPRSNQEAAT